MEVDTNNHRAVTKAARSTANQLHANSEVDAALTKVRYLKVFLMIALVFIILPWPIIWHVASQSKVEVKPVVIDVAGTVLWHAPMSGEEYSRETLWLMEYLQRVIADIRERTDDDVVNKNRRNRALSITEGLAKQHVDAYYKAVPIDDPIAKQNPMRVMVGSFAWRPPTSAQEFDLTWVEKWTPRYGGMTKTLKVKARLIVDRRTHVDPWGKPVITIGDMNANPMGIVLTWMQWFEEWEETR